MWVILGLVLVGLWVVMRLRSKRGKRYEVTIVLGSGGHTGELCHLLSSFDFARAATINVLIANTDKSSQLFFENSIKSAFPSAHSTIFPKIRYHTLFRTNQVKQSYFTALWSTLRALFSGFLLVLSHLYDTTHLLGNGPGTCVPIFYIFFALKLLKLSRVKMIFLESWCRVEELSLSGRLVKPIADDFVVHWPALAAKYPTAKYYGRII